MSEGGDGGSYFQGAVPLVMGRQHIQSSCPVRPVESTRPPP